MRRCIPGLCLCGLALPNVSQTVLRVVLPSVLLSILPGAELGAAPAANSPKPSTDWPCRQILVDHISPAAVWSGPLTENFNQQQAPEIDDLAAKLAARRLPIEDAKAQIDAFAEAAGADKRAKLTSLFVALYQRLDGERAQVIAGLERFGHGQKAMADRIRAENEALRSGQNAPGQERPNEKPSETPSETPAVPRADAQAADTDAEGLARAPAAGATPLERLQWDLRIFEERRRTLNYVCDVPTLIEQRLFALAREIQDHLD